MGAVALNLGYSWIFFSAALLSVTGLGLTLLLKRRAMGPDTHNSL
jgi:hypothetical protein